MSAAAERESGTEPAVESRWPVMSGRGSAAEDLGFLGFELLLGENAAVS
jgi:hypothetical protein